jgi:RNA polymerase sigma-70 factor, ECF subfamily
MTGQAWRANPLLAGGRRPFGGAFPLSDLPLYPRPNPKQALVTKRGWMSEYDDFVMERRGDVELAERLLSRDESALRTVIELYGGPVHGMARRVIAEPSLAEEVAQDTFLALWRRPGAFDPGRGSLQSFLLGVARNKAIDLVRREESVKRKKESLESEMKASPAETTGSPGIEERHEVRDALARLSPVQREALVLAYFGGRTYREVAEELDIPEGTAKTRLRDGLIRLRGILASPKEGME